MALKICKDVLADKVDCKELADQFNRGEITTLELIKRVKEAAKDEPEVRADLELVEEIVRTGKIDSDEQQHSD